MEVKSVSAASSIELLSSDTTYGRLKPIDERSSLSSHHALGQVEGVALAHLSLMKGRRAFSAR